MYLKLKECCCAFLGEPVCSERQPSAEKLFFCFEDYVFYPEKEMLDRILWFLTDIQREVYRLVKIVRHTQTEAADILGTSIPNINKHLKKAMDRIEEQKEGM